MRSHPSDSFTVAVEAFRFGILAAEARGSLAKNFARKYLALKLAGFRFRE
jgi:hypothetical protein